MATLPKRLPMASRAGVATLCWWAWQDRRCWTCFAKPAFRIAAEAFADRRYEPDGTLRSRKFADALIRDPAEAARQALSIVERGTVIACDGSEIAVNAQTICIHGDTPGAPEIAAAVAHALRQAGVALRSLSRPADGVPFAVVTPATANTPGCPTKRSAIRARCTVACSAITALRQTWRARDHGQKRRIAKDPIWAFHLRPPETQQEKPCNRQNVKHHHREYRKVEQLPVATRQAQRTSPGTLHP